MTHRRTVVTGGASGTWTPPTGTLAWWYGNNVDGADWADQTGNGNHAVLTGGASIGTDGLALNGSTGYATIPAGVDDGATDVLSIAAWLYNLSETDTHQALVNQFTAGVVRAAFGIGANEVVQGWGCASYPSLWNGFGTAARTVGTWTHVAMQYQRGAWRIYVDGVLAASNTTDVDLPANNGGVWYIGRKWDAAQMLWQGKIDDLMMIGAELSVSLLADIIANSPGSHA